MKKTKKMLAAMLAVSTLAAALSGCSGGNKTDGKPGVYGSGIGRWQ